MQKKSFILLCLLLSFLFFTAVRSVSPSDIVITEIGATEASGFEWIEIYNRSANDVDLAGYKFFEENTNHTLTLKQGSMIVKSHEFAVIAQDDVKLKQKYPSITCTILDSSWGSLNESGEEIALKDKNGNMGEKFVYVATSKFSLERVDANSDDATTSNWKEHVSGNTVGQINSVVVGAVTPAPVGEPPVVEPPVEETPVDPIPSGESPASESKADSTSQNQTTSTVSETPTEDDVTTSTSSVEQENFQSTTTTNQNTSDQTQAESDTNTLSTTSSEKIKVIINEFLLQPNDGEKEWIEIYNDSEVSVDLTGWTLEDGTGKIFALTSTLEAKNFLVIELTTSKLNNDGDAVIIKNTSGEIIDEVYYGDGEIRSEPAPPKKGNTLARSATGLDTNHDAEDFAETTTVTKGFTNVITPPAVPVVINSQNSTNANTNGVNQNTESSFASIVPAGAVVINEVYPNPPGSDTEDEFIELYNTTSAAIDLNGYKLSDAAGTSFTLTQKISAQGFLTLYRKATHISLNNTGTEIVKMGSPSGDIVAQFTYTDSSEGQGVNRIENGETKWSVTKTPNAKNIIEEKIIEDEDTVTTSTGKTAAVKKEKTIISKNIIFDPQIKTFLHISEIYPAPQKGKEEFVEIYNRSSTTLNISFFQIDDEDGGSKPYTFASGTLMEPGQFLVMPKKVSHLSLNNSDDSARLLTPDGEAFEEVQYDIGETGESYSVAGENDWQWTSEPTPGAQNIFRVDETSVSKKAKKGVTATTLENLAEFETGDLVRVRGKVVVLPQTFGSQYFYIATTRGVQVYMSKRDFPLLSLGEEVQVTGELGSIQGEQRIKVKKKTDIVKVAEAKNEPVAQKLLSDIDEGDHGTLALIQGEVTEKKPTYVFLDDGTGEIQVNFKKGTGIQTQKIRLGDKLQITGVLLSQKSSLQLFPRMPQDVVIQQSGTSTAPLAAETKSKSEKNILVATTGGIGSLILGFLAKIHSNKILDVSRRAGNVAVNIIRKKKNLG